MTFEGLLFLGLVATVFLFILWHNPNRKEKPVGGVANEQGVKVPENIGG